MKRFINGFLMSVSMFSVLPVPHLWDNTAFCWVVPMLPVVGFIISLLWYVAAYIFSLTNISFMVCAALLTVLPLVLSGFIHMDGYMDSSDAIFSRAVHQRKLEILKDSHVGAFAVIMFGVYMLLSFASIYTIMQSKAEITVFIFIPVISRCVASNALLINKPISEQGFGAEFKKNSKWYHKIIILASCVACVIAGYLLGGKLLFCIIIATLLYGIGCAIWVVKQFGGISGDLCGFIITSTELFALLFAAIIGGLV